MDGLRQASTNAKELFGGIWRGPACLGSTYNHDWCVILDLLVHNCVIGAKVRAAELLGALGLFG